MTYGLQIRNSLGEVVIDDSKRSFVKTAGGVLGRTYMSGDLVPAYSSTAKGAAVVSTPYPTTDQVWGGVSRPLYYYKFDRYLFSDNDFGILFMKMDVDDELIFGAIGVDAGDGYGAAPIMTFTGVHTTRPTLEWAAIKPKNPSQLPSGYGMALYDSNGNCNWAADDAFAQINDYVFNMPWYNGFSFARPSSGWLAISTMSLTTSVTGVGRTRLLGRFRRTAADLIEYIPNPFWVSAIASAGEPNATIYKNYWRPAVMVGSMDGSIA